MQGGHYCCEALGDCFQSGMLDYNPTGKAWVLDPSKLKEKVAINFCPFDGEKITEAEGYCMDCEEFNLEHTSEGKVLMVPTAIKIDIEHCPFCGEKLGAYDPSRFG